MRLEGLEIANYRSLEVVRLPKLGSYNVLIGQNNSGKSSILNAISMTARAVTGPSLDDWSGIITDDRPDRALVIKELFRPTEDEREALLDRMARSGSEPTALQGWRESPFVRQIEYTFASELGAASPFHLREVRALAQDGHWAQLFVINPADARAGNPESRLLDLDQLSNPSPATDMNSERMASAFEAAAHKLRLQSFNPLLAQVGADVGPSSRWALALLDAYFAGAFFFSPFRHSEAVMPVTATPLLASGGSNLAQVLHTIQSNDRRTFDQIEAFVRAALPDLGQLQSPLEANQTFVGFLPGAGGTRHVRLHQMGGGVEQLLMLAVVLLTTLEDCPIFVEEPESHLHPGAQRFLLDRMRAGQRQITVATHSPIFLDVYRSPILYRTRLNVGKSSVDQIADAAGLGDLLDDIGVRNGDVLLSDAVLLVEGPVDRDVFSVWSELLGSPLSSSGVNVVAMGGGEAVRSAKARSDILAAISARSPIPHLFVLDRDERSDRELSGLAVTLGDRVWVLERRELENYLLVPEAILAALKSKYRDDAAVMTALESATDATVLRAIEEVRDGLVGTVILKRIRSELGTLPDGLLSGEESAKLAAEFSAKDLAELVTEAVQGAVADRLNERDVNGLVNRVRSDVLARWKDDEARASLAPGEEVLNGVFQRFGATFAKRNDALAIARAMRSDDVAVEIRDLISRAVGMGHALRRPAAPA